MKRFTLILALVLMVAMPMMAERVTPETARKVATTFLNNNGAKTAQLTDLSKEAGFPNLYIFNAEQGFVVMAADDCVQPILGYSLTGKFVAENMPENFRWWLQGYNNEIQSAIDNKTRASSKTAKMWKELAEGKGNVAKATNIVNPLIQTKWNQNKYYNDLCPAVSDGPNGKAYTGCVATAMAQIMKFWNYPSTGIGSHSYTWNGQTLSANFGETTYDWNNMEDYYEYYYVNGTDQYANWLPEPSAEEIAAVATLMYHCGVSVDMIYGGNSTGGSAAPNAYVANALKDYFNYKNTAQHKQKSYNSTVYYTDAQWIAMLKTDLDASRPVQYGGQDPNGSGGHAFVCDGYNSDDYFHFNWGWAGHYNGYFSINNLDTGANSGEAGAGNGVYTRDQEAVFGIEPGSMVPAPTNLTYTLSGLQDITLSWNAVSAAMSYNVYCDGNLIGNTTSTTYSETAPFGTHYYYVRCVDANSQLSLPSNTVTVTITYQTPIVTDLTATLSGNNINLSWTAPEWCYPETPTATLTYGSGVFNSMNSTKYWAHRYLANDIAQYSGKTIYKISFFIYETGTYNCYVYTGTINKPNNDFQPQTMVTSKTIDGENDIWIVINYPDNGNGKYAATCGQYSDQNNHGNYRHGYTYSDGTITFIHNGDIAWLITAYITDGTYTYNLYQDGNAIAQNLSQTTYNNATLNNNAANLFTVKTNYYGGETAASNAIGFAKGTASIASFEMASNDQMTITESSTLTVNGTLSNENAEQLILENGAQLIHNSSNVKATMKKDIAAYTTNTNNWNLIASPVTEITTPNAENGLLSGSYDLYYYDEPTHYWKNYRNATFNLAHQQGYLYANNTNTTLQFAGTLTPSNSSVTLSDLSHNADVLNGFNLVGNPFACNATVDKSFYITDETGSNIILAGNGRQVKPCEGIFVQATTSNTSVTFTKAGAKSRSLSNSFDLTLTQGRTTIDRARVQLSDEESLDKFNLNDNTNSQIYFPKNGRNFAVTSISGENELPLSFKAMCDGSYTLGIELGSLNLSYLHLIDNFTGTDIDLLSTPNYTFEAKTSDYASRFRLVFDASEEDTNDSFVYVTNGQLHVINQGEAELQIIDVMGRILHNETITGSFDMPLNWVAGTYILRLSNADQVLTQKVIVQ